MSKTEWLIAAATVIGALLFVLPVVLAGLRIVWAVISTYVRPFKFIGRWWDAAWETSEKVVHWCARKRRAQEHHEQYKGGLCASRYCDICKPEADR